MNVFSLATDLSRRWPALGNRLIQRAVPLMIPFTAPLGLKVERNDDRTAEMSLTLRRFTKNHVGSVYFGAQATLAEITMGMWAFSRFPPTEIGMLVRRVEIDFFAKAKTDIRAVCEPEGDPEAAIRRELDDTGKAEAWLEVSVRDTSDQEVTKARFQTAFKDFRGR